MGMTNVVPLFQMAGFGPLGLPLTTQAYGLDPSLPLTQPGSASGGSFVQAGLGATNTASGLMGPGQRRLFAANPGPTDVGGTRKASGSTPKVFILKFLSGEYQGQAFTLSPDRDFVIGSNPGLDLVLKEKGVLRQHAKISLQGDRFRLEVLSPASLAFVNGEKVTRALLKEGDRIMVGTAILRLETADKAPEAPPPSKRSQKMSGEIEEIPVADLLQAFGGMRKSGVLAIRSDRGVGKIYLRDGRVSFCTINDSPSLNPHKAVYRLLGWTQGYFELDPPQEGALRGDMNASVESLLMEGVYQMDEIKRIEADVPPAGSKLTANLKGGRLGDLNPEEAAVFQAVVSHATLEEIIDRFAGSDLEAYTGLISLIKKGLVVVG
jgi:uncharacterized protein DUF4388/type III secretion system (T3SS) inner membrane Yop/YscD-like protein